MFDGTLHQRCSCRGSLLAGSEEHVFRVLADDLIFCIMLTRRSSIGFQMALFYYFSFQNSVEMNFYGNVLINRIHTVSKLLFKMVNQCR